MFDSEELLYINMQSVLQQSDRNNELQQITRARYWKNGFLPNNNLIFIILKSIFCS